MKSYPRHKTKVAFSIAELPPDYAYRYTLNYILMAKMGKENRNAIIDQLIQKLRISKRMLQYYRYARIEDTRYFLDDKKIRIIARTLGIDTDQLLTPICQAA